MCMTFQSNKKPFSALELPRFLTFDMDQLGKHRGHHWKKRLKISKTGNFESDTSCRKLRNFTDVCMVGERGKACASPPPAPTPPYQCLENFAALRSHIFVTFGNKSLSNLEIVLI